MRSRWIVSMLVGALVLGMGQPISAQPGRDRSPPGQDRAGEVSRADNRSARGDEASSARGDNRSARGGEASRSGGDNRSVRGAEASQARGGNRSPQAEAASAGANRSARGAEASQARGGNRSPQGQTASGGAPGRSQGGTDRGRGRGEQGPPSHASPGTVKVNSPDSDTLGHEPHPGCDFIVNFYGFRSQGAEVIFEGHSPTGSGEELLRDHVSFDGSAPPGNRLVGSQGYDLWDSLTGEPHPQQGYKIKLTVRPDGARGAGKHKVFWLNCPLPEAAAAPPAGEPDAVAQDEAAGPEGAAGADDVADGGFAGREGFFAAAPPAGAPAVVALSAGGERIFAPQVVDVSAQPADNPRPAVLADRIEPGVAGGIEGVLPFAGGPITFLVNLGFLLAASGILMLYAERRRRRSA